MPLQRVWFLGLFGMKMGVYILPILVWNRVWFTRDLRKCMNIFIISVPNE